MSSSFWNLIQQVLWISDNGFPDLGGTNEDVPCFIDEVNYLDCKLSYVSLGVWALFISQNWVVSL